MPRRAAPVGRLGEIDEVVDAIIYLERPASSRARSGTSTAARARNTDMSNEKVLPDVIVVQSCF
jgi:hypothetical protein